ncbi:Flagellar biosynthesis protein FlhF, partial [human gut metagenome]
DNDGKIIQNDIYRKNSSNSNNYELSVESVHKEVEELKTLINKVIENKNTISEPFDKSIEESNTLNLDYLKEQLNN